jgi:hypothetical protein
MDSAFKNCENLKTVTISEGVTSIGDSTFSGCSALAASLQSIGNAAFFDCASLTTVTVPDIMRITSFTSGYGKVVDSSSAARVFYNCSKLNLASQAAIRKLDEIVKANQERTFPALFPKSRGYGAR